MRDFKVRPADRPAMPPQKNPFEDIKITEDGKIVLQEKKPEPTVSLESLKAKDKKNNIDPKAPSKENISSLKQALASVVEKSKNEKQEAKPPQNESKNGFAPKRPVEKDGPQEVPEDVLRKILEI